MNPTESDGLPDIDKSWMVKRDHLKIREEIGKGAFGTVYKADFFGIDVAVKQICPQVVKDPMEEIFVEREIAVLKYHYISIPFITDSFRDSIFFTLQELPSP